MICKQCGNQCNEQSRFCTKCGSELPVQSNNSIQDTLVPNAAITNKGVDTPNPNDDENEHPLFKASYYIAFFVSIPLTKSWFYRMEIRRFGKGTFLYYFNIALLFFFWCYIVLLICSMLIFIYGVFSGNRQLCKSASNTLLETIIGGIQLYLSIKINALFIPFLIIDITVGLIIKFSKKPSAKQ